MGNHELPDGNDRGERELCRSNHFYAAYVFDEADSHKTDITTLIEEAGRLRYPVRYWWLSQAMNIQNSPDRLITCVHHPANDENAGLDLYDARQKARFLCGIRFCHNGRIRLPKREGCQY